MENVKEVNTFDLGGGYALKHELCDFFSPYIYEHWLYFDGGVDPAGYLVTVFEQPFGYYTLMIWVEDHHRGKGLGERMVRGFVSAYGALASDVDGNNSDEAIKMWERIKAEKVPTDRNSDGYFYRLKK